MSESRGSKLLLAGTTVAYLLIGFEVLIMITPFTLYFYSAFGPFFETLERQGFSRERHRDGLALPFKLFELEVHQNRFDLTIENMQDKQFPVVFGGGKTNGVAGDPVTIERTVMSKDNHRTAPSFPGPAGTVRRATVRERQSSAGCRPAGRMATP